MEEVANVQMEQSKSKLCCTCKLQWHSHTKNTSQMALVEGMTGVGDLLEISSPVIPALALFGTGDLRCPAWTDPIAASRGYIANSEEQLESVQSRGNLETPAPLAWPTLPDPSLPRCTTPQEGSGPSYGLGRQVQPKPPTIGTLVR